MTAVVTDNCQLCRFTECVSVCPAACFHADDSMVYIDPDMCVDCGSCIPVCPVNAICDAADLPEGRRDWIAVNARMALVLPVLDEQQPPLPTAADRRAQLGY